MTEAKHMQGPWHKSDTNHPRAYGFVYGADGYMVADCTGILRRSMDEAEANARLIAATPELLEAVIDDDLGAAHDKLSNLLEDPFADKIEVREAAIEVCLALNAHHAKRQKALAKAWRQA